MSSNVPENSAFKQQRLQAWQLILTPRLVIGLFITVGIVFIPIGGAIIGIFRKSVENKVQYDGEGTASSIFSQCSIGRTNENKECVVSIDVSEHMEAPIFVYYELDNFYQSHQRYVQSVSFDQLLGSVLEVSALSACDPLQKIGDQLLNPCGLIANSLFNDVFTIENLPNDGNMSETGISWESDRSGRFAQPDGFVKQLCPGLDLCNSSNCLGTSYSNCSIYVDAKLDRWAYWYPEDLTTLYLHESYPMVVSPLEGVLNEHFIVWMRTAALPNFRKLYGRIDTDIPAGSQIEIKINANFYVSYFKGKKSIVLSSSTGIAGVNAALGIAYLVIGGASLVVGIIFLARTLFYQRKVGFENDLHID